MYRNEERKEEVWKKKKKEKDIKKVVMPGEITTAN